MIALVLAASIAQAEPYMAVREGLPCGQCHINRTGGGLRTGFGNVYAQTALPAWTWGEHVGTVVSGDLAEAVAVGANLRLNHTTVLPEESVYQGEVIGTQELEQSFSIPEGNLYLALNLLPDRVRVYFDQTVAPFFGLREAVILIEDLPAGSYVKAGQLLQPYGLRILDDDASIRTVTQVRYDTPQLGLEAGIDHKPVHVAVATTNGGGTGLGGKVTGTGAVVFRRFRLGASGAWVDETVDDEEPARRWLGGGYGGVSIGRLTLLGEVDAVVTSADDRTQLAALAEGDLLVARGVNAKLAYDWHDRNAAVAENHRSRVVGGLELFPAQFVQVSLLYHLRLDLPQAPAADRADRLVAQLHGFF